MRRRRHERPGAHRPRAILSLALLGPLVLGSLCEGTGSNLPGTITQAPIDPRCTPIGGPFPSGFDLLPGSPARAVAVRFLPAGLLRFDLGSLPPTPDNAAGVPALPADSDGDGWQDAAGYQAAGLCPPTRPDCRTEPVMGSANAAYPGRVLVTTSGYEQVLLYAPDSGALTAVELANPTDTAAHRSADRPLYPSPGTSALRTGVSTTMCVHPPTAIDSAGDPVPAAPQCDPDPAGFLTRFTAATAVSRDRLFVATSNLASPSRGTYYPGTVLVHVVETDAAGDPARITPDTDVPVIFTTAFNPTGLTAHRTPGGRDVVLVTLTGAIDGAGRILTDGAVDVIDVASRRVVATVPLGRAGPSFGEIAIDRGGHLALLGAESDRRLYAVDLAALDDPALYAPRSEPVVLDGSTAGFADARVFDARAPLSLPPRPDGPPGTLCTTRTNVTLSHDGAHAYATDWCDGSITVLEIDWTRPLEHPLSARRFDVLRRLDLYAPKWPANFGLPAAPSMPRTRAGIPGVDFDGPDLFFLVNEPEGQLCAARVEP